ncbi:CACTA transposable element [Cucumis melo var. makuwa]|uniref:CACTA transposable element n=1 Tax=Cucumis melo var. makuwa TaxID=1194695 RepID=A0A5A7TUA3_CUCMM|nr:CACTA transposable element [Cucumis melo var. makuwa]
MTTIEEMVATTTRKWSIPDDEKDVGIKNVGNKDFPDAVNNASGDASGKQSFPTHHEGVGKYTLGKGTETERGKERKSRDRRRDFCCPSAAVPLPSVAALPRRCPSPPSATLVMIAFVVWRGLEIEEFRLEDEMPMNVGLMHVKVLNGWSNKSFDMLLELLRAAFPMCNSTISSSFYEAKRKLRDLGLGYETIHACKYDCVLYWKEFVDLQHCPTCGEARYKEGSADMRWHRDKHVETDDVLRHPADAEGWKHFDYEFPDFGYDPRNVRLGLASDGFNPFGQMSTSYSMWLVVLLPYNLPP